MWAWGSRSIGASMFASTTSTCSGCWLDSQKSELPQRRQKDRVPCSEERNRTSSACPSSRVSWLRATANQVTNAAPWLRRHIEQWQCPQKRVGRPTLKRMAPQKQDPQTRGSGTAPPPPPDERARGGRRRSGYPRRAARALLGAHPAGEDLEQV